MLNWERSSHWHAFSVNICWWCLNYQSWDTMCIWNAAYDGSQIRRLLNIKPELYRAIRIQTGTSTMVGAVKLVHWWWQNMPGWSFWVSWHLILPSAKDPAHILHCHLKPSLFFIKSSFPPMNHIICHLWLYYVHYAIYYVMYYFIDS